MLGPLQVWRDDHEVELPSGRQRALLAALLLRANQVVATSELVVVLWDTDPPGDARSTAQTYVRRLRGALGSGRIQTRPGGYLLTVTDGELDLAVFDELLAQARHAIDPSTEATRLAEALSMWRGSPLSNVPSDALHCGKVPALTERRLRALERRVDLDLGSGCHADQVGELRELTSQYPLRERFWAQLMTALAGDGRQAEALQAYRDLRARLAEDLGTDPAPELQELHRTILRGEVAAPRVGGADRTTVTPPAPPAQLPPDTAAFAGRVSAMTKLDALLEEVHQARLTPVTIVAITGTAGVGKTALAVRWSHRVRDRFDHGQLYVDLHGYADAPPVRPIEALAGFLQALGVPAKQVPTEVHEATATYRSLLADKRILVVLDNAADADQVRPLLPGGGGCLVVVTSRRQLGGLVAREGARPLVLDTLTRDESLALLTELLGADRVTAEPTAAADLIEMCGRLPLALRIAAANLVTRPVYGLASYVRLLGRRDQLAELEVAGDEHGAAVRAAFDLSYHRLPDPTRHMFRLLGLAPGTDITPRAAGALAGTSPELAHRMLDELAGAHLLDQHAPGRFGLHPLLRLYAADRAHREEDEPAIQAALRRLYDHYLDAVAAAGPAALSGRPAAARRPGGPVSADATWRADPAEAWAARAVS